MASTIRFDPFTIKDALGQRVYFKFRWYDEWTRMPQAWCQSATWTTGATLPTAHLRWRYGIVLEPGAQAYAARFRNSGRLRHYVKVEYLTHDLGTGQATPLVWYGYVDMEMDDFHGAMVDNVDGNSGLYASGVNHFICTGLEGLLQRKFVSDSYTATSTYGKQKVRRAIAFNANETGNRSKGKGPDNCYLFAANTKDTETWSSFDIVEYLMQYQTPRYAGGSVTIPFEIDPSLAIPMWDKPHIETEGRTLYELLNVLMPRQRLLGWTLRVDEGNAGGVVKVVPFTLLDEDLYVSGTGIGAAVPKNPFQYNIVLERDRTGACQFRRSGTDIVDQVIVRGARRTSTGTFSFADQTLEKGWTSALESEYEAGASGAPDYPAATEEGLRMVRNYLARSADKFARVYSRFALPAQFAGKVGNGFGTGDFAPLMPQDADSDKVEPLAAEDARFCAMVMFEGVSYTSLPIEQPPLAERKPIKPIVLYPRSDSTEGDPKYRQIDAVAIAMEAPESLEAGDVWSATVQVGPDGALWVQINSAPREFLAGSTFSRLDCDIDPALYGNADFNKLIATLSVEWSAYAEAVYPSPDQMSSTIDAIRTLEIFAGESYRCDYMVPDTIVGIVPSSAALIRSPGGFIRDDRDQLMVIAQIAFAWYRKVRKVVSWESSLVNGKLQIGDYIVSAGDPASEGDVHFEDINSVVTLIEVTSPLIESETGGEPPPAKIRYETGFGEIDPLALR